MIQAASESSREWMNRAENESFCVIFFFLNLRADCQKSINIHI